MKLIGPLAARLRETAEPRPHIGGEQFRFLHRGKMTTPWHLGPALHIEKSVRPFSRRPADVFWEARERRRDLGAHALFSP